MPGSLYLPEGHENNDVPTFWLLLYINSKEA